MNIRTATMEDAQGMSDVLSEIVVMTGRERPRDVTAVRTRYLEHPDRIRCSVAEDDDGRILGFQSLLLATQGNPYGVTEGWGIIGTHVSPRAARQGVGTGLFAVSRDAAQKAGLPSIDASIADDNPLGLGYYEAMGFRTYRLSPGTVCKRYDLG